MGGWMDDAQKYGWMYDGLMDGCMIGDGWMTGDGCMDGWIDGGVGGWMMGPRIV